MKVFEIFYLSYYFLVRKDKYLSKTGRVRFLIELVLMMHCASILFIIFGTLNIKTDNIKNISILIISASIITHWVGRIILGKGKEQEYIQSGKNYNLDKIRVFRLLGLFVLFLSFVIMILSAIFMSYLWRIDSVSL